MYVLTVEDEFAAAHQLAGYSGKCEHFHGHNWKVSLEVSAGVLDSVGLAVDFGVLKEILARALETFDHRNLNELPEFRGQNPTSENLARVIHASCREMLKVHPVQIRAVTVWESRRASVRYAED